MIKKDFIKALAAKQGITQAVATSILIDVKEIITAELVKGSEVSLGMDFGTFKPTHRTGTIPGTDTPWRSNSVKFKASAYYW